jgi:hypothetical protein
LDRPGILAVLDVLQINHTVEVVVRRVEDAVVVEIRGERIRDAGLDDNEVVAGDQGRQRDLALVAHEPVDAERVGGLREPGRDHLRPPRGHDANFVNRNPRRGFDRDVDDVARLRDVRREAQAAPLTAGGPTSTSTTTPLPAIIRPSRTAALNVFASKPTTWVATWTRCAPAELAVGHAVRVAVAGTRRQVACASNGCHNTRAFISSLMSGPLSTSITFNRCCGGRPSGARAAPRRSACGST